MATHTVPVVGVSCPHCDDFIFSISRHDFVTCNCGYSKIDGGQDLRGIRLIGGAASQKLQTRNCLSTLVRAECPTDNPV